MLGFGPLVGGLGGIGQQVSQGDGFVVEGSVVLMKKEALDLTDFTPTAIIDGIHEFLGSSVSLQLVSSTVFDPIKGDRGVVGDPAFLEESFSLLKLMHAGESKFRVRFKWDDSKGIPGAVIVKNQQLTQFYLKTVTIEDFPRHGRIHFVCNSWVYPNTKYNYDRIFFANISYLPKDTPVPMRPYREEELDRLRGDDVTRKFEEWDRIYNYASYNDLGMPDAGPPYVRPILGGSTEYPYPRRGRTNRPPTLQDPKSESRTSLLEEFYVPRDERFGHLKKSDFLDLKIKGVIKMILPFLDAVINWNEFQSFDDVMKLYVGGIPLPTIPFANEIQGMIPFDLFSDIITINKQGERIIKLSMPHVIKVDRQAWMTDEEFAREMLAGVNPLIISRLKEFPPASKLDPAKYGNQNSTITAAQITKNLEGLTLEQALNNNRLYILDHHDTMMPYLNRINSTDNKVYATRTLLLLRDDSTLKPLAIELSLPHPQGEEYGAVSKVITPSQTKVAGLVWQMAKTYVAVNDSGVHQLVSHWLNTHACMEPFVIATNRHLSVVHPIYKLLYPHYRDTMNINAMARQFLINAQGIIERTFFPEKYSMEMSAVVYNSWNFTEQALPADLIKRGIAVEDPSSPNKIRLLMEDYPYAVDGLAIWSAIETWVTDYCSVYYPDDAAMQADPELQAWWNEIREVGHGDKKDEPWWPKMQTVSDLIQSCATIIWVASALHAAVNFGQYPYGGFNPNRPSESRRFLPEPGTKEYEELSNNPERALLRTITPMLPTALALAVIEILSNHTSDEIYIGQRDTEEWTTDQKALDAFKRFGEELTAIEKKIVDMNRDPKLKNRIGPVKMPYTLLYPVSTEGLTMKGIPNSISI